MPFQKGNKLSKGGKRENSGRAHDWLRDKCRTIIERKKLIEFLGNVAAGEPFVEKVSIVSTGKVFEKTIHSAEVKDRMKALEMLADRAFGKATQPLEHSGTIDLELEDAMTKANLRIANYLKLSMNGKTHVSGNGVHG